jgi:small nuclear ribonucleoprotein F
MIVKSYFIVCICRCNNVLYLRGVPEDEEIEDAAED